MAKPSSRRKSCGECVKAKRKCGMEFPICHRCKKKDIICSYPNKFPVVNEMDIPELDYSWLDGILQGSDTLPWSGKLHQLEDDILSFAKAPSNDTTELLLPREDEKKYTLDRPVMEAALQSFKLWPKKWLREGKAPFIHTKLHSTYMPKPLQDAYAACAVYSTKTAPNEFIAFNIIESKADELLRSADQRSWSPMDLLAAVQALLIFQFIRLFDGDIKQRALAEDAGPILEAWTEELRLRTTDEQEYTTLTAPSWRAWIFSESIRRTITMSLFLSGIYSFAKLGYCTHGPRVSANSFTAHSKFWAASSPLEWERAKQTYNPLWIPRMGMDYLLEEAEGSDLDDFGLTMLISYKGQDVVDHWLASSMTNAKFDHKPMSDIAGVGAKHKMFDITL